MKVGFIGLGAMGLPMAKNVQKAGHELYTMTHRNAAPAKELSAAGAHLLENPEQIARASDVVITIVPADAELSEVVFGPHGLRPGLSRGKVLIDMTTCTSRTLADVVGELAPLGVEVLDAPVSGGTPKAASGELTAIVGGKAEVLEKYRPLLSTMASVIYHVGDVGAGKVVKMVNQLMAAVHMAIIGEAFTLGVASGADPKGMAEVIRASSGYSRMLDLRLDDFLLSGSFEPGFKLDLMRKDVNLAVEAATELRVPLQLGSSVAQLFTAASRAGDGAKDFSAVARYIASLSGQKLDA